MYRIEHLAFASNMESHFAAWLEYSVAYPVLSTKGVWLARIGNVSTYVPFAALLTVTLVARMMRGHTSMVVFIV